MSCRFCEEESDHQIIFWENGDDSEFQACKEHYDQILDYVGSLEKQNQTHYKQK